jgi:hypothetical protein
MTMLNEPLQRSLERDWGTQYRSLNNERPLQNARHALRMCIETRTGISSLCRQTAFQPAALLNSVKHMYGMDGGVIKHTVDNLTYPSSIHSLKRD